MRKDNLALPVICTDSVLITAAIEARKQRHIAVADLPNTYLLAKMDNEEEVLMVMQ